MKRRNFFKSLMAAGIVISAPKIITETEEFKAEPISKPDKVISDSPPFKTKGVIMHNGHIIAGFNEMEIHMSRELIDATYLYEIDENGNYIWNDKVQHIRGRQNASVMIHAVNVNYQLAKHAFESDIMSALVVESDDMLYMSADVLITEIQLGIEQTIMPYFEWTLQMVGEPTISTKIS